MAAAIFVRGRVFHQVDELIAELDKGVTRPFAGEIEAWSYPPPDDNARAGAALRKMVMTRLARRRLV